MKDYLPYGVICLILLFLELAYFRIADRFDIVDRPNKRSSHSITVIRGGGIIFMLGLWVWAAFFGLHYLWFLLAVTLVAGVSFIDDVKSLPQSVRLVAQFASMVLMFYQLGVLRADMWWIIPIALVAGVGASNIINFMDGVNGITGAYALASVVPLFLLNRQLGFVSESLIVVVALAGLVFCLFNFRAKGKAKCFAGDAGSIGIAYILLFFIGCLIVATGDLTYLIFLVVYGIDGGLTICHRVMLHEHLGQAHRKHAYQLMANELKIGHVQVSLFYALLQLAISLSFIWLCPCSPAAHWLFFIVTCVVLSAAYVLFMKKYFHLHKW